jgi:hypothetical protein
MTTWNHRVRLRNGWFEIVEAYYDDAGKLEGQTVDAIAPGGETVDELRDELNRMLRALDEPVIDGGTG